MPGEKAAAAWADDDHDGDLDFIYPERGTDLSLLYRNDGDDTLSLHCTEYGFPY